MSVVYLKQIELLEKLKESGLPYTNKTILRWEEKGMPVAINRKGTKRYIWEQVEQWLTNQKES